MTDHDHPDTDLTDPHGEAEALRKENARLRRWNKRLRAALVASRAPNPVVNAGSCQPGDLIARIAAHPAVDEIAQEVANILARHIRALPAAPVDEAQPVAEKFHDTYERLAPSFGYETRPDTKRFDPESPNGRLMIAVCEAVMSDLAQPDWKAIPFPKLRQRLHDAEADLAALRAQPDWKAMAERLGEASAVVTHSYWYDADVVIDGMADLDAALSDLAKMKGE